MKTLKIEVIGSGCKKCKALFGLTEEIIKELNINTTVLYITDINKIVSMGIMSSPVLVINDKPVLVGILPDKDRLKEIISKSILGEELDEIKEDKGSKSSSCGNCSCGCKC